MVDAYSLAAYAELIAAGRASGYRYLTFAEVAANASDGGRQCLLRHDVDVSVAFALDMARVEAAMRVRSTYFLMPRSPAYNLLSRHTSLAVREMVEMGHDIGLHFDAAHPLVIADELTEQLRDEAALVGRLAGRPVSAFSFHQPSPAILQQRVNIPELINTYNPDQLQGWHYASDTNRTWRGESGLALLRVASHRQLQLLTHPMWWVCAASRAEAVWDEAMKSNFEVMQRQFLDTEGAYGSARRFTVAREDADS